MQMTQALDDLLCRRHPALYADRHADMQSTAMCWGFEAGDGWFGIIDALSEVLTSQASAAGLLCPAAQQVKQKFGSLRFRVTVPAPGRQAIALAEEMSRRVCEVSGRPGRLRLYGCRRMATLAPGLEPGDAPGSDQATAAATEADPLTGGMDVPPLAFTLDDMAQWRADVLTGPVEVPAGWRDLADAVLHVVQRERVQFGPVSIQHIWWDGTGMRLDWDEGGPSLEGLPTMAAALSKRLDPLSGTMDAGAVMAMPTALKI